MQHLGQGANQAFEDIYHLVRTLTKHHPDPTASPRTDVLTAAFSEYEQVRIPRADGMVKGARARGNMRVVPTVEAAKARDELVKKALADDKATWQEFDMVASGPFQGKSEI